MRPFARDPGQAEEEALAMVRIGLELRRLREEKGVTLRALGEAVGLSAPFLSDVEHGRRKLSHVAEIEESLGAKEGHFARIVGWCSHCNGSGYEPKETKGKKRP